MDEKLMLEKYDFHMKFYTSKIVRFFSNKVSRYENISILIEENCNNYCYEKGEKDENIKKNIKNIENMYNDISAFFN